MFLFLLFFFAVSLHAEPIAVYLTIQKDPASSMTVCWIENPNPGGQSLKYRAADQEQWYELNVVPKNFPNKLPYTLFTVELTGLKADTKYEFSLPGTEEFYSFKTLPEQLTRPVTFVSGGDIYHDNIATVEQMNRAAALQNPDFALLGGDLAYSGSRVIFFQEEGKRWVHLLKCWCKTMRQSDGSLIPLIATIGNHDINGRFDQSPEHASFYYFFFPTHSDKGYRVIDFGNFLSLWVLDTGHARPVAGEQTVWLEKTLEKREGVPIKMALYHVPAYPSVRSFDNKRCSMVRKFWVPLFEKYGLKVAFENHDHSYKRTHLIKNGKVAEDGVLYVGDGAWGVEDVRTPKERWYIAEGSKKQHVVLATINKEELMVEALGSDGKIFDQFKL